MTELFAIPIIITCIFSSSFSDVTIIVSDVKGSFYSEVLSFDISNNNITPENEEEEQN